MKAPSHPIQPLIEGEDGKLSFKTNNAVLFLLKNGGFELLKKHDHRFPNEDLEQICQLSGVPFEDFKQMPYSTPHAIQMAEMDLKLRKSLEKALLTMRPDTVDDLIQALDGSEDNDLGGFMKIVIPNKPGGPATHPELN